MLIRKKFHDIGNELNMFLAFIACAEAKLENAGAKEDADKLGCADMEQRVLALNEHVMQLKKVVYELIGPDRMIEDVLVEIERRNTGIRIVVADTDEKVQGDVKEMVRDHGYQFHVAKDLEDAKRAVAEKPPHIVICGVDGLEFLKSVKKSQPQIKCVALMGSEDGTALMDEVKALGIEAVLTKPLKARQLDGRVTELVVSLAH
ncbi:MAG: response regulator [Candidatus Omnitrophica bacterium]|nr:response regulator [Candidatus Omnitrophota bacterium]